MSVGSPGAMKTRCPAKLQFRGRMNGARNGSFALHFQRRNAKNREESNNSYCASTILFSLNDHKQARTSYPPFF
ncbi:hypothetical protein U27_04955 [Candidatus Vecturithrix granuli]|uniref:Uncharacterized protein n=1 Tax=Vecturithrix granuli TaxID=1499967 RepID=A0A081C077_VECG1|nr:hypothetical protein U27_04955 [Candidatus Vecturithrix granuli]